MRASPSIAAGHDPAGPVRPTLPAWLEECRRPIKASTSALGYATESVRARLGADACPVLRMALAVMDERCMTLLRDVERLMRLVPYLAAQPSEGDSSRMGHLAGTLRRVLDEAGPASRRRILVRGWRHGGRAVPAGAARDAIQPVLENALVHGRGRVVLELHPCLSSHAWLTVSDSGPGMAPGEAAAWLTPLARLPVTNAEGRPRLGLATAQLAARALGCSWRVADSGGKGLRLQLEELSRNDSVGSVVLA